jgi:hypothetical protein
MLKTITFSEFKNNYYDREIGKAMKDLTDFFNKHKEYKIIKIVERQGYIENCGNGTKYYNLDVIYEDNTNVSKQPKFEFDIVSGEEEVMKIYEELKELKK